jgi:hypothetical protein
MANEGTTNLRIRDEDHAAAMRVTETFPLSLVDVLSVFRHSYEICSEKQRLQAIRRVTGGKPRRGRRPQAA